MRNIVIMAIVIILILTGCTTNPIQEDIIKYVNETLPTVVDIEAAVIAGYESATGENYVDDATTLSIIQDEVTPKANTWIAMVELIKPDTAELRAVHEIYIESVNVMSQAMGLITSGIVQGDVALVYEANEKMALQRKLTRQFLSELEQLAKENNVDFNMK